MAAWYAAKLTHCVADGEQEQTETSLVQQTGRLFVRNLPYTATATELGALFQEHGELTEVHLVSDRQSWPLCFQSMQKVPGMLWGGCPAAGCAQGGMRPHSLVLGPACANL